MTNCMTRTVKPGCVEDATGRGDFRKRLLFHLDTGYFESVRAEETFHGTTSVAVSYDFPVGLVGVRARAFVLVVRFFG